ncbi:hypothetical protein ACSLPB_29455, partial [Escherichia coli]
MARIRVYGKYFSYRMLNIHKRKKCLSDALKQPFQKESALQYFEENLPHRPYHTDDLAFGLRISGKGRALLARYIQQNQP